MDSIQNSKRRQWLAIGINAFVIACYLFLVTGGKMIHWPGWYSLAFVGDWYEKWGGGYYDDLAKAFAHGQTSLLIEPHPAMMALHDPYDAEANAQYRLHDALLYDGKYCLYWGPVPALLMVPFKWLGGGAVDDSVLTFLLTSGSSLFSTLLIVAMWNRLFSAAPWWTVGPPVLAAGLGNAAVLLFFPAMVYQAAIAGGQCFLIAGLYGVFTGLAPGRVIPWRLGLSGLALGLAIGSRISLMFSVAFLCLMVLWRLFRSYYSGSSRTVFVQYTLFGIWPFLAVVALAGYNLVRFGSWSEMGIRYQLYGANHADYDPVLTSSAYVVPNIINYFFRPFGLQTRFPFLRFANCNDPAAYPGFIPISENYTWSEETIAGLFCLFPFLWVAFWPALLAPIRFWRRREQPAVQPKRIATAAKRYPVGWLFLSLLGVSLLGIAAPLLLCGTVQRYMADCTPALTVLAAFGFGYAVCSFRRRPAACSLVIALGSILAFLSALLGMLTACAQWPKDWFVEWNPSFLGDLTDPFTSGRICNVILALVVIIVVTIVIVAWETTHPSNRTPRALSRSPHFGRKEDNAVYKRLTAFHETRRRL